MFYTFLNTPKFLHEFLIPRTINGKVSPTFFYSYQIRSKPKATDVSYRIHYTKISSILYPKIQFEIFITLSVKENYRLLFCNVTSDKIAG